MLVPFSRILARLALCSAIVAACAPPAAAEQVAANQRSMVTVTEGANGSRVVVEGPVLNRAIGPGAIAETNIGGQRSTARGSDSKPGAASSGAQVVPARGDLVNLDLAGRVFAGSNWAGRKIVNVDLSGADLRGANLRSASLTNVDLSSADLREADLTGALLVNVELDGAKLRGARMADGQMCTRERCR